MTRDEHVDAFEHTMQLSYEWLREYAEELGSCTAQLAYRCLRAALHAIRDRLPANESAALAAQLPLLLRGVYYEGWRPSHVPAALDSVDDVYDEIATVLEGGPHAAPRDVLRAALSVLNDRIDAGEIRKLRHQVGEELRRIWPEPPLGAPPAQPVV
ncbi:DUF2267 domain-containing protein [Sandaracinus amylolyticus]|uniref:DUF2267 domain-containing protein n=1 Tax=Sandaracinus amylolyticus TaxID=927083 RepID=A0A0F6YJ89_9BACT|nr:DUF2267 domain-containing protein [Sandaracinus amylolyticus]AKF05941.1 hypothetical protein DB32_003090 [Sandaracinus amylolyticus]